MRKILLVGGNMLILVIMMLGVIIGMKLNLKKTLKVNGVLQIVLTGILILLWESRLEAEKTFLMNWQNLAGRVCSICCLRWQDLL